AEALLQLTHVRLDRENLKCIDNLECLGNVTNLYLQHNNIEYIENLETLQQLNFLTLASNKISEVKNLKCLNKLKFLDLSDNNITEFSTGIFFADFLILIRSPDTKWSVPNKPSSSCGFPLVEDPHTLYVTSIFIKKYRIDHQITN
ncbi:predicted protein, partial [Nematostella vectensis]